MSEQTSEKRGVKSDAQKKDSSRHGYDQAPASSKVSGAGGREPNPEPEPRKTFDNKYEATRPHRRDDEKTKADTGEGK